MSEIPQGASIEYLKFSWKDIEASVANVAQQIKEGQKTPDMILGITRGGLIPLGLFARDLGVRNVASITAQSYTDDMQQGQLSISNAPNVDMTGKRVLVVDELADSGITLQKIKEFIQQEYAPAELTTAVLYIKKDACSVYPDFFAREIGSDKKYWLHFPWEEPLEK